MGVEVAKGSVAAISKVAISNGHCIAILHQSVIRSNLSVMMNPI